MIVYALVTTIVSIPFQPTVEIKLFKTMEELLKENTQILQSYSEEYQIKLKSNQDLYVETGGDYLIEVRELKIKE